MAKYVLSLCILLLVGCATYQGLSRLGSLESTSKAYGKAMRWGEYQLASSFIKTQGTDGENPNLKELEMIKITSYKPTEQNTSEDKLQAHQTVEIKYYNTDCLIEKTLIDKQLWEYDAKQKAWYLQSALPDFK
ncbi:MAG: hypothetical protein JRF64_05605 [Deltaproteobacteria bacterium]|nr:hypothetical protein [Deltaproteobacteria bacterium]